MIQWLLALKSNDFWLVYIQSLKFRNKNISISKLIICKWSTYGGSNSRGTEQH